MKSFIFLPLVFLLHSCVSSESLEHENNKIKRFAFGKGGGFTGNYTEFILNENGKVYKYDFKNDREIFYKTLKKEYLTYFLERIEDLGLEGVEINQPGNITYYIEIRIGQQSINKITWGNPQYYPPKNLMNLHDEIFKKLSEFEL